MYEVYMTLHIKRLNKVLIFFRFWFPPKNGLNEKKKNPHDPLERLGIPSSTLPQVTASIAAAPDQDKNAYPMQPTADGKYNVFCLGYGVGCDVMATEGTDFRIVGGSENDELAKNHFEKRTGAKDFGTLEELHAKLQQGLDLGPVHVMAGTMPCTERSKLWQLKKKQAAPEYYAPVQFAARSGEAG